MIPIVILEDAKLIWRESEVNTFIHLWEEGSTLLEISKKMKEHPDNIALLIMDQAQKGKIN